MELPQTELELELLMERAARKGAREALNQLGLHDENAHDDIRELRGLLDSYRDAKKTAWSTIIKMLTTAFVSALIIGAYVKFGGTPPTPKG